MPGEKNRVISWFSCGAASAVATKIALKEWPDLEIINCEISEEHPDNRRFLLECEEWFGKKITIIGNDKYQRSVVNVCRKERYLVGPAGAKCTTVLKKKLRKKYDNPHTRQVFGYTAEEEKRADRFIDANPECRLETPLIDYDLGKSDCLALLARAGIELPAMYRLGYRNTIALGALKRRGLATGTRSGAISQNGLMRWQV